MRVVVDTNVLISAVLKRTSTPAVAVRLAVRHGRLLRSEATMRQLRDVMVRPHLARLIAPAAAEWILAMLADAEDVAIDETIIACRDPTDDKFLEVAVNDRADVLVSGDGDLLALDPFRGIPIPPPGPFLQWAAEGGWNIG